MRDTSFGGYDQLWTDNVDLFLIATHGAYKNGRCYLLYGTPMDAWLGESTTWRFGDTCNLE